jgi:hypothetical protein
MQREPHYLRQFFSYDHLPEPLQAVSQGFAELAGEMDETLPENPEKTTALRKLLEAKDCAVRAMIFKGETPPRLPEHFGREPIPGIPADHFQKEPPPRPPPSGPIRKI